jgi:hypothetical protein
MISVHTSQCVVRFELHASALCHDATRLSLDGVREGYQPRVSNTVNKPAIAAMTVALITKQLAANV